MGSIVILFLIVIGACVLKNYLSSAKFKGQFGEHVVVQSFAKRLDPNVYHVINDVMLNDGLGGTTQIDHVVVSRYGIFPVETKNYSGWIFGSEGQSTWTQSLPGGRKFHFQNPMNQNFKHVCVLAGITGLSRGVIKPIVFFIGEATLKTRDQLPPSVCACGQEMENYVRSFADPVLSDAQVDNALNAIECHRKANTAANRAAHVDYLRRTHGA